MEASNIIKLKTTTILYFNICRTQTHSNLCVYKHFSLSRSIHNLRLSIHGQPHIHIHTHTLQRHLSREFANNCATIREVYRVPRKSDRLLIFAQHFIFIFAYAPCFNVCLWLMALRAVREQ